MCVPTDSDFRIGVGISDRWNGNFIERGKVFKIFFALNEEASNVAFMN